MRIKIIGDNNCARATRHLLRLAGFAVTEFLPVEAITQAPHFGYAITIDVAGAEQAPGFAAPQTSPSPDSARTRVPSSGYTPDPVLVPESGTSAGFPASMPDHSTHAQPADADREASNFADAKADASSSSIAEDGDLASARARRAVPLQAPMHFDDVALQEASHPRSASPSIHFDSVDSLLEAAVLRHVTQFATGPVVVDRPGGVVHSERELRIVISRTGDAKADEAAAVAVEFGVLRGLLDLTAPRPAAKAEKSAAAPGNFRSASGKKWWRIGLFAVALGLLPLAVILQAVSPGVRDMRVDSSGVSPRGEARTVRLRGVSLDLRPQHEGTQAEAYSTGAAIGRMSLRRGVTNGAYLRLAPARALVPARLSTPAQGEFAVGGQTKITDGVNTLVIDPCKGQTKLYLSINQTTNTQLAPGTAAQKLYICSIHVVVAAATNVALVEGTGSVCATGTAGVNGFGGATAATGWNFAANGGIVLGTGDAAVGAEGTSGDNLCVFNSGSGQVSGGVSYVVQ